MKLEVTKAWCLAAGRREKSAEVGAGAAAFGPEPAIDSEARGSEVAVGATQIAFGRAVQLLRRQRKLTVEQLAQDAHVDLAELVSIENDPHHRAEPRAVSQLAHVFKISAKAFQQLAGNAVVRDARVREEALRFAARSGSIDRLTTEESRALEQFVAALGALSDNAGEPNP
jgi:HTH-type transcriptional regulator, competence development regulator